MLKIKILNTLSEKIGEKHGISEAELKRFLKKSQPLVDEVFKAKSKPGYNFVALPDDVKSLKSIQNYAKRQKKEGWQHIVILGIGGSALGAIAVRDALISEFDKGTKLHVVDNIDPTQTATLLENIPLKKTLFVVISKSGTTTEPMALYALVKERLLKSLPKTYQKHLVFVTDPKEGLLREMAKKEKITAFDIPPKIGGRFSVLTSVGLLPCALAGISIEGLLKGAKWMRNQIRKSAATENPALLLAGLQYLLDKKKGKCMTVLMPYSNQLFRVGDWYRQLLAESIGKNKNSGPTPINALGTTDQHSQLQLYNEGPNNKWVIFMRVMGHQKDSTLDEVLPGEMAFLNGKKMSAIIDAAYLGTAESLRKNKRPNATIEVSQVDAQSLGALFMLFEFQVALLGKLYKVNAFDQPGVEESKRITKKLLQLPNVIPNIPIPNDQ